VTVLDLARGAAQYCGRHFRFERASLGMARLWFAHQEIEMRAGIVLIAFLPFLYYASKDNLYHFRGRRVSLAEHLLHAAIGVALLIVVSHAMMGNSGVMLLGLLFFVVAGGLDEYVWHRNIPEVESDLHAKEHLALLIFVVATLVVNWLDQHEWRLPPELYRAVPGAAPAAALPTAIPASPSQQPWWRAWMLPVCLLPYAYFGLSDNIHHARHRRVSWPERIVHLAIVLAVILVVAHVIAGNRAVAAGGLVVFLVARAVDEWGFHRDLPGRESDMHAKTHLAFLIFVVLTMTADWLADRPAA
jgi:hypothetical protein